MNQSITIGGRRVGHGEKVYIIAELSANHGRNFDQAAEIVRQAAAAGADAIKVQTYTADTLTIKSAQEQFRIGGGTLWDGRTLYDLYAEACMPWEWQPKLQALARELGLQFFSTPFDHSAVEFLEQLHVPVHKIASFECVDLPLLRLVAATGKPIIMSTGMATQNEIVEAIETIRQAGGRELALLKCTSAYPADPGDMNLRTIPDMMRRYDIPIGLSDHSMGAAVPVAAVAIGACIIEKHLTLKRDLGGPDGAFSMEPDEFKAMVDAVRTAEQALGTVSYQVSEGEDKSRAFRRSLFVVEDVPAGGILTSRNVRSIRPGHGLHTRHLEEILGRRASKEIKRGTPLDWSLVLEQDGKSSS
jgi:N-acetylneuraminate synthase